MVRHRAAGSLIDWVNRTFAVGPGDTLLFVTSLCFDLSVYDLFGVLAAGGTVRVASRDELRDPERLTAILGSEGITIWDSTPPMLAALAPHFTPTQAPLQLVLLSGDWVP